MPGADKKDTRILVVGAGSIGRRHLSNLRSLGYRDLAVVDPMPERREGALPGELIARFPDHEAALAKFRPDAVLVCTPPVFHIGQARAAIAAGADCFVEKPLSHDLAGSAELEREAAAARRIVQIGYNLRFAPAVREIRSLLDQATIGRVFWARAEFGQYLPDWRPWRDYRNGYTARKELGGGIILDASHEIDLVTSMLGSPVEVRCLASKVGTLEVDVEDSASIVLRFDGGVQADVHVDFLQRAYTRSLKVAGDEGTIAWEYGSGQVRTYRTSTRRWDVTVHATDPNEMYRAEIRSFMSCVRTRAKSAVDLETGIRVLRIALAAKRSAADDGGPVRIAQT